MSSWSEISTSVTEYPSLASGKAIRHEFEVPGNHSNGEIFNVTHHIDQFRHQDPRFSVLGPYPVDPGTE